jgi:hypothetical protein
MAKPEVMSGKQLGFLLRADLHKKHTKKEKILA